MAGRQSSMQYVFVTNADELPEIVASCRQKPAVAIDTEFARFNTYYPIVGLVQIFDGEACYLIDPVAIPDLAPLADLLADKNVVKILHACSEDIEVFCDCLGVVPEPIFDTQIAAALLGVGFSVSYQNLVNHHLDILVPKEETRSDWLQRPLTDSQLDYAALDVIHLLTVYELQVKQLAESGRAGWVQEECSTLAQDIPTQIDPEDYYKKVKNLWRLNARQFYLMRRFCAWREVTARERNMPRNRVVDEKAMFQIAALGLKDRKEFRDKAEVTSQQLRHHAEDLERLVAEVDALSADELPDALTKPSGPVSNKLLRSLKDVVENAAKDLNVAPEMLAKRRHLEQFIRSEDDQGAFHLPSALLGWREEIIGTRLISEISK
jgi:ribonuclease D